MQEKINELKDYAELAQASYFYFDLEDCILQENETIITLNELLNLSYNGKIAGKKKRSDKNIVLLVKVNSTENLENYRLKISFKDMRFNFISLTLQVALVLLCFTINKKMNL
ncbi:TPA: hypothetical protein SBF13_001787 [Campylobacter jejuni]|uniref:hypothetical protein n=1 Tax=Campylobacter jejuni TaxID=197 RepID=UPI001002F52F|nr:hypothetical protein [Campylobacter jejuni]EFR7980649.1 hypothetical protein [Campylobacter jejuni]EHE5596998.1 hypothetical protein [Campylobacter jejuni]EIU4528206.1 hypothetical protein [Campylobacter jejuni]ELU7409581.1 hypothetical protein [Campylobacter jejuni]ELZ6006204.1 hypothetical protein [Campylobacter jejuni]